MSSTIIRIAARGEGVAADGRHAPFATPGDGLAADGTVFPGPHHAQPPCRHFPTCGGCQLQHVDDGEYAAFVIDRLCSALNAQGVALPACRDVHISPPRTRRRAAMRAERRGKSVVLGFNQAGSNRIVDMRECHVVLPELFALVAPLRALLVEVMPEHGRASVTMTRADQGVDLLLGGFEVEGLAATEALRDFADAHRLARLSVDEGFGASIWAMPAPVTITLSGTPVGLPEGAFLQATSDGEAKLVATVREMVGEAAQVVDLFAGLGTFALGLPGKAHAVEGMRDAVLALKATGRTEVEHRDLFRRPLTRGELDRFDAIVLDPPRAGAREQVAEIAGSGVPIVAYVSCNPATFARDARALADGGYALDWVQPVGQFRWSTHVELAARFARK